jgi:hypothetical protein
MDNVEKLRVMLQHWIEHNKGHMEEFEKWHGIMKGECRKSLADSIHKSVELMGSVNAELERALKEAGGAKHDDDDHHHHGHDHDHHHHHH